MYKLLDASTRLFMSNLVILSDPVILLWETFIRQSLQIIGRLMFCFGICALVPAYQTRRLFR
ncbi:hypothetical protein DFH29DRAFT_909376 [Suillus ampliporus]|nr:hypothetical protein DFH29DRAFT_909376 [Suillus ampliporus]